MFRPITVIQTVAFSPYLYRYADPGPYRQAEVTKMVIRGGLRVGVMEGDLVMVDVEEGVKVGASVGEGILVIEL
jgi:hypothetical protein